MTSLAHLTNIKSVTTYSKSQQIVRDKGILFGRCGRRNEFPLERECK